MLPSISFFSSFCSRQRRQHQRRQQRLMPLSDLVLPSNQAQQARLPQANRPTSAELLATEPVFHCGDYMLGDENCPFLYGPADMRY